MSTRVVFDKRTLRRKYGAAFTAAIRDVQQGASFLDEVAQQVAGDPAPAADEEPVQVRVQVACIALFCRRSCSAIRGLLCFRVRTHPKPHPTTRPGLCPQAPTLHGGGRRRRV